MSINLEDIEPDIKHSLYRIYSSYFDGSTHDIQGRNIWFPNIEIHQSIEEVEKEKEGELILGLIGSIVVDDKVYKCKRNGTVGYIHRVTIRKKVFIRAIFDELKDWNGQLVSPKLMVDRTFGLFSLISNTQVTLFNSESLERVRCDKASLDNTEKQIAKVSANLTFDVVLFIYKE